jgi:GT2 family glycosyltransferase
MADLPRISVITPSFNSAATIARTLDSVLDQQYGNLDYLVVDGGSKDATVDILRQYEPRGVKWTSEPDRGIADAFSKGIARADGELIGIVNSDDAYESGCLNAMAQAHAERKAAGKPPAILHGDMIWQDGDDARLLKPRQWGGRDGVGVSMYFNMPVNHPTCFVPAEVYAKVGTFDATFRICMDLDFLLRAYRAGVAFEYVPRVISRFHVGGVSTQHTRAALAETYRAQRHNGLTPLICGPAYLAKFAVNRLKAVTGLKLAPGRSRG